MIKIIVVLVVGVRVRQQRAADGFGFALNLFFGLIHVEALRMQC